MITKMARQTATKKSNNIIKIQGKNNLKTTEQYNRKFNSSETFYWVYNHGILESTNNTRSRQYTSNNIAGGLSALQPAGQTKNHSETEK